MLDKEYIERNSLIKNLRKFAPEQYTDLINQLILKQPIADVQPVVHAKWELVNEDENVYMCSNCGDEFITIDGTATENHMLYCPFCGAKMDKE